MPLKQKPNVAITPKKEGFKLKDESPTQRAGPKEKAQPPRPRKIIPPRMESATNLPTKEILTAFKLRLAKLWAPIQTKAISESAAGADSEITPKQPQEGKTLKLKKTESALAARCNLV